MATYYVRADGTAASKVEAVGPDTDASKCLGPSVFGSPNTEAFEPNDIVIFSSVGGAYTDTIYLLSSGDVTGDVVYEADDSVVVDVSTETIKQCIYVSAVDYVQVNNFKDLRGCGGAAVMQFSNAGNASLETVKVTDCYITSNYGSGSGQHDGFNLAGGDSVLFTRCKANKCRPNPVSSGSHQGFTAHVDSHMRLIDCDIDDCNEATAITESANAEVSGGNITNIHYGIWRITVNGTASAYIDINSVTITPYNNAPIYVWDVGCNPAAEIRVKDSDYLQGAAGRSLIRGKLVDNGGNKYIVSNAAMTFEKVAGGTIAFDNSTFEYVGDVTPTYNGVINFPNGSGGGSVTRCRFYGTGGPTNRPAIWIDDATGSAEINIKGNLFNYAGTGRRGVVINRNPVAVPINIDRNVFNGAMTYAVYITAAPTDITILKIRGNIFNGCSDNIRIATWCTPSYNCYYNSPNEGGTGSITTNPAFIDTVDFKLLKTSPCYGTGIDVGLTEDAFGNSIPNADGTYSMGWFEFKNLIRSIHKALDVGVGVYI